MPGDTNEFLSNGVDKQVLAMKDAHENDAIISHKLVGDQRTNCGMDGGAKDCLSDAAKPAFDKCVQWARLKFESYFANRIKQLTHNFPSDAKTVAGKDFWSAPKRFPDVVKFDENDPVHMKFTSQRVISARVCSI